MESLRRLVVAVVLFALPAFAEELAAPNERSVAAAPPRLTESGELEAGATRVRVGFSTGLGVGPTGVDNTATRSWVAAEVAFFVEVHFSRMSVRVSTPIQGGPRTKAGAPPQFFSGIAPQFRANFSRTFSWGVGLEFGAGVARQGTAWASAVAFGPTLAPFIMRLGADGRHELAVEGSFQFVPVTLPKSGDSVIGFAGALILFRYSLAF